MCHREGGAEDKASSQLGVKRKEVPLCPNNTPEKPRITVASRCLACSILLSVFISFSDFNFLSFLKRRKPEEIKCIISIQCILHKSAHSTLSTILGDGCYLTITKGGSWKINCFPKTSFLVSLHKFKFCFHSSVHIPLLSSYYILFISHSLFKTEDRYFFFQ